MNLRKFLDFNHNCPVCKEPLKLFMQWKNSVCFKASKVDENTYHFLPFLGLSKDTDGDFWGDGMVLEDHGDSIGTYFESNQLAQEARKYEIYFFYLCNEAGFRVHRYGSFDISLLQGCYYRSTPMLEFVRNDRETGEKNWSLELKNPDSSDLVHKDECFGFKYNMTENQEKVYMVDHNYEDKETTLWYYATTTEEREEPGFKPKLYKNVLPLVTNRMKIGIEDRDKLVNRLDGWIIMS